MKRLRHPIRAIREPFGSAGLIVACIAIVLALTGAAFAAKGALTGKQKKEVEKIAKKFAGKPGAPGPTGAPGANGTNGKDGAEGKQGPEGKAGSNGSNGAAGKSVTVTPVASGGAACEGRGGAILEQEDEPLSETEICSGEEGSPWTDGGVLPSGALETGAWAFHSGTGDSEAWVPLSFPIPLPAALTWIAESPASEVHFQSEANFTDFDGADPGELGCLGNGGAPIVPAGNLCIYGASSLEKATFAMVLRPGGSGFEGVTALGGYLEFNLTGAPAFGSGAWGYKAP